LVTFVLVLSEAVVLLPMPGISTAQQETANAKMLNAIAATTVCLVMRRITLGLGKGLLLFKASSLQMRPVHTS